MICPECSIKFDRRRRDQHFCSSKCNAAFEARAFNRSRRLYRALYGWRVHRDDASDLRFICSEIGSWVEEDRKAGRGAPPRHDHSRDRGHQIHHRS